MSHKNLIQRRTLLKSGVLAGTALTLTDHLFKSELAKAQTGVSAQDTNCIMLYMTGGPAQQETFDMKPDCDDRFRGEFLPTSTNVPGIQICEHLPLLAKITDKYAIIRSTWHESNTHGVGVHYNLTGLKHAPRQRGEPQVSRDDPPSVGGAIRQLRGDRNGLPAAVHLPVRIGDQNNFRWGGQHAGFLGQQYDPLTLIEESWNPGTLPNSFLPPKGVGISRLRDRVKLLTNVENTKGTGSPQDNPDLYVKARERALSILQSDSVWKAFLIEEETSATIERYGDNKFGRSCLVARRLVERGVSFVTVPWMHLHSTKNFDTHAKHFKVMRIYYFLRWIGPCQHCLKIWTIAAYLITLWWHGRENLAEHLRSTGTPGVITGAKSTVRSLRARGSKAARYTVRPTKLAALRPTVPYMSVILSPLFTKYWATTAVPSYTTD